MTLPNLSSLREGAADCPSDLRLDQLVAGELDAAQRSQVEAHVAGCATCPARVAERTQGWAAQPVDPRPMLAAIRRGASAPAPSPRWRLWGPLALIAAAALVLLTWEPGPIEETRFKGGLALHVFRLQDGRAQEVASGAPFAAGDRLRFVVDLPRAGAVSVVGVDQSGSLYVAWPMGAEPVAQPAGLGLELSGAVALDATPGEETLYLVHCPGR